MDELKTNYTLRNQLESSDELRGYGAIGKRSYEARRTWLNEQTSKLTGRKKQKITEFFTYYIKTNNSQEETQEPEFGKVAIITYTYTRITQKKFLSRILSKTPRTTIKDKKHEIKHRQTPLSHPLRKDLTEIVKDEDFIYHTNKLK